MVFGVVITNVGRARAPVDQELALACAILYPIETHVDSFRPFLFDGVIREALCSGVVDLHRGGGLWMTHFLQGGSNGDGFLAVRVRRANFRLCSGSHDVT